MWRRSAQVGERGHSQDGEDGPTLGGGAVTVRYRICLAWAPRGASWGGSGPLGANGRPAAGGELDRNPDPVQNGTENVHVPALHRTLQQKGRCLRRELRPRQWTPAGLLSQSPERDLLTPIVSDSPTFVGLWTETPGVKGPDTLTLGRSLGRCQIRPHLQSSRSSGVPCP